MRFEKWQALGNDYVILEAAELPWELTPGRVRRLCDPHLGIGADGVLLLSQAHEPGFVARLRIFADADGRMNRSITDVGGEALVVSQFTLYADVRRGNRPGFTISS